MVKLPKELWETQMNPGCVGKRSRDVAVQPGSSGGFTVAQQESLGVLIWGVWGRKTESPPLRSQLTVSSSSPGMVLRASKR